MCALACAGGCSRPGAQAEGPAARAFLEGVVKVRGQMTADDMVRIPAMIRGEDFIMMTDQVVRIGRYRLALSKLDPARAEAKAVRFRKGMESLLNTFRFVCLDTAELFREIKEFDTRHPDREPLAPALLSAMRQSRGSTLEALDSLLDALGDLDTSAGNGGIDLAPIINSVRADRANLRQAMAAQDELARQVAGPPEH